MTLKQVQVGAIGAFLGLIALTLLLPTLGWAFWQSRPVSYWIEAQNPTVYDTALGVSPVVKFPQTVYQTFRGDRLAVLRKVVDRDGAGNPIFEDVCWRRTVKPYLPDSRLPVNTTLDYWMDVPPQRACEPREPGQHALVIYIEIDGVGILPKSAVFKSNTFDVVRATK